MGKRAALRRMKQRAIVLALMVLFAAPLHAECRADRVDVEGAFGTVSFQIELADTVSERSQGLMHRTEMADEAGMLFVYPYTRPVSFWMKNTLIPLDMIFINARGVVHRVHANAIPHDTTSIPSGGPVRAVLEINGGLARKMGIRPGSKIRHPALPQERAAWPCSR